MKVAIIHDSFTQMGGAERVVENLHELFPKAPVFTLVFDKKFTKKYADWDIRTSPLQVLYDILGKFQHLLPWMIWGVNQLNFNGYDVVISSSSGFVKNIQVSKNTKHICYCHTPPRFLWIDKEYVNHEVPFLIRPLARYILFKMRKWDLNGSKRVSLFIANSKEVQKRIKDAYERDSEVIYPGVDTEFWRPTRSKNDYFLIAGRLQTHKNNELALEVFNSLGIPLHIVGTGRQEKYLKSLAKPNVTFLGAVDDNKLRDEYSGALGFIYPQVEDFGLMPLEAAACGTATIALNKGGALETVLSGVTGEFFNDKNELKQIILNWQSQKYFAEALLRQAQKFSKERFKENILMALKKYA